MDLEIIEDAIYELENSEINADNVLELASLYIVRQNNLDRLKTENNRDVEDELNDILPYYRKYCETKRKYQMHEITEDAVITGIERVCKEISELISTIYRNTDMAKERKQIRKMLETLYFTYKN